MTPKFPCRIMLAGLFALGISAVAKKFAFLSILGQSPFFEWGCSIATALCFSAGMFLSLCGMVERTEQRWKFFALHLIGLLTFCAVLSFYFVGYIVMTKIYDQPDRADALPQLVESARTAGSEKAREKTAQEAYDYYGLILAYRLDNGQWAAYQPTGADTAFRDSYEESDGVKVGVMQSIDGQLRQFPWLFGFYLGGFFVVYLAGTLWLMFCKPRQRQ